jgi:hypothetical protein
MYTAIRRYTVAPGRFPSVASRAEESFLPVVRTLPGFVAYFLVDGGQENGRDVLATVSIFDTQEAANESVRRAALWVREHLHPSDDPNGPEVTAGPARIASIKSWAGATAESVTAEGATADGAPTENAGPKSERAGDVSPRAHAFVSPLGHPVIPSNTTDLR